MPEILSDQRRRWTTDDVAVVASFPRNVAERRSVSKKGKTLSRTASIV